MAGSDLSWDHHGEEDEETFKFASVPDFLMATFHRCENYYHAQPGCGKRFNPRFNALPAGYTSEFDVAIGTDVLLHAESNVAMFHAPVTLIDSGLSLTSEDVEVGYFYTHSQWTALALLSFRHGRPAAGKKFQISFFEHV